MSEVIVNYIKKWRVTPKGDVLLSYSKFEEGIKTVKEFKRSREAIQRCDTHIKHPPEEDNSIKAVFVNSFGAILKEEKIQTYSEVDSVVYKVFNERGHVVLKEEYELHLPYGKYERKTVDMDMLLEIHVNGIESIELHRIGSLIEKMEYDYEYWENGRKKRLVVKQFLKGDFSDYDEVNEKEYIYNELGIWTKLLVFDTKGKRRLISSESRECINRGNGEYWFVGEDHVDSYTYSEEGSLLKRQQYDYVETVSPDAEDGIYRGPLVWERKYDSKGNVIYGYESGRRSSYEYDSHGNLSLILHEESDGEDYTGYRICFSYKYDDYGNWLRSKEQGDMMGNVLYEVEEIQEVMYESDGLKFLS